MAEKYTVLVVDDEEAILASLRYALEDTFEVLTAATVPDAIALIQSSSVDVCLLDLKLSNASGMGLLEYIKRERPEVATVVMTAYGSIRSAVECMKAGAFDYVTKPLNMEELTVVLQKAGDNCRLRRKVERLELEVEKRYGPGGIIGNSAPMRQLYQLIEKAKWVDSSVLILGESGTGKELVARALHFTGKRRDGPFEVINCSAIPQSLLESELFGYEKGAFTGALRRKIGRIEAADGGTLFLDEIGDMDISAQAKLLRVIEDRRVAPLGTTASRTVDVRFVAATNKDLAKEVAAGTFREDLFYRLNVVTIRVPPLRERREDIPLLVRHFLKVYADKFSKEIKGITPRAMAILQFADYRGNVRELENAVERAVALKDPNDALIDVDDLPESLLAAGNLRCRPALEGQDVSDWGPISFQPGEKLADLERRAILETLKRTGGKKALTARLLGISERSLRNKLHQYKADLPS